MLPLKLAGVGATTGMGHLAVAQYRPDIDGLRAIAVLSVLVFHAFPGRLPSGFIGVDIFFVISGYLISSIILRELKDGRFSFSTFYARRIRRIVPALVLVLASTALVAWFLLLPHELEAFGRHVVAGAGFVSNLLLWRESGYFDAAAEQKPLLHLWSLGIEEQFYIAWPLLLALAWRGGRRVLALMAVILTGSFMANVLLVSADPVAAFYSPVSRLWELAVGGILAYVALHRRISGSHDVRSVAGAVLLIAGLVLVDRDSSFPGWLALLPTGGAALLLSAPLSGINRYLLANRVLVWVGLISYPLYLWHWPLLSLSHIWEGQPSGRLARVVAVCLSIVLAYATYRLVERPIRAQRGTRMVGAVSVALVAVALTGCMALVRDGFPGRFAAAAPRSDVADDEQMQEREYRKDPLAQQLFGRSFIKERDFFLLDGHGTPGVAVVGDSHAYGLYKGLRQHYPASLRMIGRGTCLPLYRLEGSGRTKNRKCQPLMDTVIEHLARASDIDIVIINAFFNFYIDDRIVLDSGDSQGTDAIAEALGRTLDLLADKSVVLSLDVPELDTTSGCKRRAMPVWQNVDFGRCTVTRDQYEHRSAAMRRLFREMERQYRNVQVFDPAVVLCDSKRCGDIAPHQVFYKGDGNHLSAAGADLVGRELEQFIATKVLARDRSDHRAAK